MQEFHLLSPLAPSSSSLLPPPQLAPARSHPRSRASQSGVTDHNSSGNGPPPANTIGYVLADKRKFRCAKKECHNSTFGRLADLRRHYEAAHVSAANKPEYYCPVSGCARSRWFGGGGGRSFGTRKDKCDEHVRNVHKGLLADGGRRREGYSE
ncbi:uncharacterized protein EI97DRAFT_88897 [Westerdykella ornata]|uniref:C2H2-type domain-containing protein n=1 Tax=Westerdykella ornata TaxID=318751 RepID=A0A6A6JF25_WESOR|nr:uncharacterized protein EI97DRAFT_88897 [Westerdykella ornata]KAF2274783.1 hypothetical protein EI97DRAFT_88897 [Westerdykella ornata]